MPQISRLFHQSPCSCILRSRAAVLPTAGLPAAFRSIPTLMIFRDGILLFNQAGAAPESALEDLITQVRGLDMDAVRSEIEAQQATSEEPAP